MKLPLPRRVSWLLLGLVLTILASLGVTPTAEASHIRAGDIQAKSDTTLPVSARNPRRIFFKMVLFTDNETSKVDEDKVAIFFGDGSCTGVREIPRTTLRQVIPGTQINVYYFEHTYNAPGSYLVSYIGELRNGGVRNMSDSNTQTFYISTRVTIAPELNINRSPVLNAPAYDKAGVNQVWLHNPAAFDADGDSLVFELRPSQQVANGVEGSINIDNCRPKPVVTTNYIFPNLTEPRGVQVPYLNFPGGGESIFTQDRRTGQIVWNAPNRVGIYNFAFAVLEYRRSGTGPARLIGEVIRDMQILVEPTNNLRPIINIPQDLCVIAGTPITQTVTATDPNNDKVTLSAFGGVFPPATFVQNSTGPPQASGTFRWTPQCTDVASDPYTVVFKADDQPPSGTVLIDEKAWRITVVGPPPQNLGVRGEGNSAILTWDRYTCSNASRILIYRKEGPSNFTPGPCETGIPASSGFVQVGSVPVGTDIFRDDRGGLGLERGKNYCYRIYAEFPRPKGGASIASAEVCLNLQGRSAVLTNVTVDRTDATNGAITVRWTKPFSQSGFIPPVGYRLLRSVGTAAPTVVFTTNNLDELSFVDTGINTLANTFTYRLEFFSNAVTGPGSAVLTETSTASSVRLEGTADVSNPSLNRITLNWTYTVPWNNALRPTTIYRRDATPGSPFVQVGTATGTATGGTFVDQGTTVVPLRKGQVYCYYVETNGTYSNPDIPDPLLNKSQEKCIALNAVPCPPVLTLVQTNCDSLAALPNFPAPNQVYSNKLRWTLGNTPVDCSREIAYYRILYRETPEGPLVAIDSVTQQSYVDRLDRDRPNRPGKATFAGCYAIQAVDAVGNRSALSNIECKDNCLFFVLPNIFTPNADQRNDTFRPKVASPIRRTRFQAFNRWGVKVYESDQKPLIEWEGTSNATEGKGGVKLTEGVYYYIAEVEFADFNSTKRTYKGWVEITR
ncbi:gliding motility-associated C-terminal domain-containing protein [Hymenobacter sp. BT188]|uniref:T9SS type B sorting domain-containing protein n=1 Tax=Hymenobacter sp. BT188 TaxID=2763504 RepID=UPI0016513B5B|nr:gliding motility-associated C-terminal domain-containing protein [Hymenobacter sp. BT188]MBC6607391.1 gliding motility-associated C-terminal domain-containing protein [Hymenobacter sp. BT188]